MNRFATLKSLLEQRRVFKLVCGAGNEDPEEVRRLSMIYTLAGAIIHDVSANTDIVKAAAKGIDDAYALADNFKININIRPYINVSIGIKGDPHIRKAYIITEKCIGCGSCADVCRQEAIIKKGEWLVEEYRCIGCGDCENVCPSSAIYFTFKKPDFKKILPECVDAGCEIMELHGVSEDDEAVMNDWLLLNEIITDNFISVCLDRSLLSNKHLIQRIKKMYDITGERMIVQADGVPMSGEGDDFNTTLQAVACADIVIKSGIPVIVLISGGTNSKSGILAKQCGVNAHGISVGSYARKIVRPFIKNENFMYDKDLIKKSIEIAQHLVKSNMDALNG
ncbi:MAG TPA: 4Fe-4S binding protein [Syntrophorhabdaceae bacterium]|nr:4Fe-4S binding protein [Syntrophorhabdaceae bacterium]HPU30400.1 4Fe-4S binding protein [Syntrophorhabdaceae bacterium]